MDTKEQLEKLRKRLDEIKPIVSKSFPAFSGELEKYRDKNINIFNEYYSIREKIRQLEYELKTPQEKEEYDEYLRKLKLKSQGKPLI